MPRIRDLGINAIPTTKWPRAGMWASEGTGCGPTDTPQCLPHSCGPTPKPPHKRDDDVEEGGRGCGPTDITGDCPPKSCEKTNRPKASSGGLSPASVMQLKQQLRQRIANT